MPRWLRLVCLELVRLVRAGLGVMASVVALVCLALAFAAALTKAEDAILTHFVAKPVPICLCSLVFDMDQVLLQLADSSAVKPENVSDCRGAIYAEEDMYDRRVYGEGEDPRCCTKRVYATYGAVYGCEWRDGVLTRLVIPYVNVVERLVRWRSEIEEARRRAREADAAKAATLLDDL